MTDVHSINLDKLRNIVQKFQHRDFTAAQVAADYWDSAKGDEYGGLVTTSRHIQFEQLLLRNAALLGIQPVPGEAALAPKRWHVA
ncbi:MAG: hypothetical protein ACN6O3_00115 [Comamonas sp.]